MTGLSKLNRWTLERMTLLNGEILARRMAPEALVAELSRDVLPLLPDAEACSAPSSKQLMVHPGLWGSSVGRHFQERDPRLKSCPRVPLQALLRPAHFMDVMRQFAVHWAVGDVSPSGAQDAEFLSRDFLLGFDFPGYVEHARRVFPALLAYERHRIIELSTGPTLPKVVVSRLGVTSAALSAMNHDSLLQAARCHPVLAACYLVLASNSRVSAAHLMLTKKYLFKPQQKRDAAGLPDGVVVSNRAGTTGMLERLLDLLHRARMRHPLAMFDQVSTKALRRIAGVVPTEPKVVRAA